VITKIATAAYDNGSRDAPCVGAGWFGVVAGWVAGAGL